MSNNNLSHNDRVAATHQDLNSEEKAVLDTEGLASLSNSNVFTFIWRVKLRLQFTGWLQYIPTAMLTLVFFLVAALVTPFWLYREWQIYLFLLEFFC